MAAIPVLHQRPEYDRRRGDERFPGEPSRHRIQSAAAAGALAERRPRIQTRFATVSRDSSRFAVARRPKPLRPTPLAGSRKLPLIRLLAPLPPNLSRILVGIWLLLLRPQLIGN